MNPQGGRVTAFTGNMMTDQPTQHDDSPDASVPQNLRDDLTSLYDARVVVPPELDDAILADARRARLGGRDTIPFPVQIFRVAATGLAAAAAVALVIWLHGPAGAPIVPGPGPGMAAAPARQDVNGDGTVDILDAFTLARRIEAGSATGTHLDMNDDGLVDRADVDAIVTRAVSLRGGRS